MQRKYFSMQDHSHCLSSRTPFLPIREISISYRLPEKPADWQGEPRLDGGSADISVERRDLRTHVHQIIEKVHVYIALIAPVQHVHSVGEKRLALEPSWHLLWAIVLVLHVSLRGLQF